MLKEQIPVTDVYIIKKKTYCVSLVSVENDVNVMFSLALKPSFFIKSIFSFDNSALVAPPVDC
jgi:hypothetical protein